MKLSRPGRILASVSTVFLLLVVTLGVYLVVQIDISIARYGVFASPEAAFQNLFASSSLAVQDVPITLSSPNGCDQVWFVGLKIGNIKDF